MALMGNLRRILSGRRVEIESPSAPTSDRPDKKDSTDTPINADSGSQQLEDELLDETASEQVEQAQGTQAQRLVEVVRATNRKPRSASPIASISPLEPAPIPEPSIMVDEFRSAAKDLSEHIDSLSQQFSFQTGHFDEISQRLVRLEDALQIGHQLEPMVERLTGSMNELNARQVENLQAAQEQLGQLGQTASQHSTRLDEIRQRQDVQDGQLDELNANLAILSTMKEQMDGLADVANHLTGRLAEVQQQNDRHTEQLGNQRDAMQDMAKHTAGLEQSQTDSAKSMQSTMERLANEIAAVDRRSSSQRTLVVLAAAAATTAAILALIGLISS